MLIGRHTYQVIRFLDTKWSGGGAVAITIRSFRFFCLDPRAQVIGNNNA